jgi:hypothetical protein
VEWEKARKGFTPLKSVIEVLKGCVGALTDFQPTIRPTIKESNGFPRSYYSVYYQSCRLNCQAMCHASLRFHLFTVISPDGQTNDAAADEATGFYETIDKLPSGLYVARDAA